MNEMQQLSTTFALFSRHRSSSCPFSWSIAFALIIININFHFLPRPATNETRKAVYTAHVSDSPRISRSTGW